MREKRVLSIVLLLILLTVSGCGRTEEIDDYATNIGYETAENQTEETDSETAEETDIKSGIPKDEIKVGVLHLTDPAEGSGYTYTHDLGIQGMQANLGLADDQIIRKLNVAEDKESVSAALQECIDEGCTIIFATSWGYMETVAEFAEKYPDIYFSHGTGYMSNGTNFNNYFGRIYQARYLSGIVAGMKTRTNKIGYVAAMDSSSSEVTGGIDAFALGLYSVNPDAKIYVKITNSWYDPEGEEAAARELLEMGCDVMAQHCDTSHPQKLAQEMGVYGIGYNSDMSKETPDSCLCSVIWNWSAYYTTAVQSLIDGTWDGSNYYGGLAEGLVDITSLADFCEEGTQEKVDEMKAKMLTGEFNVFDGELETNTGEIIGEPNGTLDDATITGGIDWYYKNVEIIE